MPVNVSDCVSTLDGRLKKVEVFQILTRMIKVVSLDQDQDH